MKYFELNNGRKMPALGLGTLRMFGKDAEAAVICAVRNGYRHIDTASSYQNEKAVGRGIAGCGIPREELFITVKIWPSDYVRAKSAAAGSLRRLGIDYADLVLLHHPVGDVYGAWSSLEELVDEGVVRGLGLSNFSKEQTAEFIRRFRIRPSLLTVENHPYAPQNELRSYLNSQGIVLEAWYPLGHADHRLMEEPVILRLAEKYNKTPVQILLRWHIQIGNSVLPGSKNPEHIRQNIDIFDFVLSEDDMTEIAELDTGTLYKEFTDEMRQRYLAWEPDWDDQE
ncbi:MAG: aldo/keto reductase [Solobacterium sp.]|nr:aldo/keto reductase [Solobacterium sp.]